MSNTTEPPVQKKHLPWFLEPQPAPSAGCCLLLASGLQLTPCLTGVLEFKFIKDASCDSDGATGVVFGPQKGQDSPLDHQKLKKKIPQKSN